MAGKISEFDILAVGGRHCGVCSDNKGTFGQKLSILGRFAAVFAYEGKQLLEKSERVTVIVGGKDMAVRHDRPPDIFCKFPPTFYRA